MNHKKCVGIIKRMLAGILVVGMVLTGMPTANVEAANEVPGQTEPAPENPEETPKEENPGDDEVKPGEKAPGEEETNPGNEEKESEEKHPNDGEGEPGDKNPEEGESNPEDEEDVSEKEIDDREEGEASSAVFGTSVSENNPDSVSENALEVYEPEVTGIRVVGGNIDLPGDWDVPVVDERARVSDYEEEVALLMSDSVPAKYEPETGSLPLTRSQSPYGSCWAHSAMALAEIDMMKHSGVSRDDADYSELHLAYFSYNGAVNDPLGGLEGDANFRTDGSFMGGGNISLARNVLTNWVGAADEDTAPYPHTKLSDEELKALVPKNSAFSDIAHLQNVFRVNLRKNADDAKRMIMEYGGVGVSYYADEDKHPDYYNAKNNCYYQNDVKEKTNHAVIAVGWDDKFSKDNFTIKPDGDGAWLIRNSWDAGKDTDSRSIYTYFWLSYYDASLSEAGYAFDFEDADNYHHNYQYDGGMQTSSYPLYPYNSDSKVRIANVFTAKAYEGGERLEAVGIAFEEAQVPYKISIYTNLLDGNNPESGTLVANAETTGTSAWTGFYTISLNNPVNLVPGESFSVVVELEPSLGSGANSVGVAYEYPINASWYKCEVTAQPGQSFYNSGSGWADFGEDKKGNLRIKAYTVDDAGESGLPASIELPEELQSDNGIEVGLGDTYRASYTVLPRSAKDRSVMWESSDPSIVTVDENGLLTGMKAGEAEITVTSVAAPSVKASFHVTVFATLRSIKITGSSSVTAGETLSLQTVRTPSGISADEVQWESADERVLTVEADGVVTGVAPGYANVTAGIGEVTASKEITCEFPGFVWKDSSVQEIKWSPSAEGATIQWPGGPSVKTYRLYRYDSDSWDDKKLLTEITAEVNKDSYSYLDKNVEGGKVYRYLVEATVLYIKGNSKEEQIVKTKRYTCPSMPYYHAITYHLNGGENNSNNPAYYREAYSSNRIYNPKTRAGYTFTGWYFDENLTQKLEGTRLPSDLTGPIDLYAGWEPIPYSIIYYGLTGATNHEENPSSFTIESESFTLKEPTKPGYRFLGWYTDSAYTKPISEIKKGVVYVTSETTLYLYAEWEEVEKKITYELDGGVNAAENPSTYISTDGTVDLKNPTKLGYDFQGWYKENTYENRVYNLNSSLVKDDLSLYAKWLIHTYKITYNDGGTHSNPTSYTIEDLDFTLQDAVKSGYQFEGWYTDSAYTKPISEIRDRSENLTLYAKWRLLVASENLVYKVNFNVHGHGTAPAALYDVKAGSTIDEPAAPGAEGYVFKGWCKDAACTTDWDFAADIVQSDITLYARWLKKSTQAGNTFQMQEMEDIYYYTGNACKPVVRVYDGATLLKAGKDYTVKYFNNVNANAGGVWKKGNGQGADFNQTLPYVQIIGKGNYTDEIKVNFDIHPAVIVDEKGNPAQKVVLRFTDQFVTAKKGVLKPFGSVKYIKGMKKDRDYRLTLTAVNVIDGVGNVVADNTVFDMAQIPAGYAGEFLLKVEGIGNYEGSILKTIQVTDKAHLMKNARITLGKNQRSVELDGECVELMPSTENSADTFTVKIGNTILTPDEDYTVSYLDDSNQKVGKATLVITGLGEYVGTKTANFTVRGKAFTANKITVTGIENKVYTGRAITQNDAVLVYNAGQSDERQLTYGRDYTVSYAKNINKGTAAITFKGLAEAGFSGSFKKSFKIKADNMNAVNRAKGWDTISVEYSKAGAKPAEQLVFTNAGGVRLKNGKDYKLSYRNNNLVANSRAEKAPTIIVKGKGNYEGSFEIPFTITKADLRSKWEKKEITIRTTAVAYQPKRADDYAYKPAVKVLEGKTALRAGMDVEITYRNNTQADYNAYIQSLDAGNIAAPVPMAIITVNEESSYMLGTNAEGQTASSEIAVPLTIYRNKLTKKNIYVEFLSESIYTGAQVKPKVQVFYLDAEGKRIPLTEKEHYTLSYGANNKAGKNAGSVTISGIGSYYGGDVTVKFAIQRKKLLY